MFSPERFPRIQNSAVATGSWWGPLVTASSTIHTKGTWTSLVAATSFDAYLCGVQLGETQVSGSDTSMLVDIGYDPAAGTTYTVEIPNILAGFVTAISTQTGGRTIWFPVSIPKGSQVAARCQALISSDDVRVGVILLGGKNRSNPFPHRGAIKDYGADTATSGGTLMANAAADTKGAWTQLGADTTRRHSGLVVVAAGADSALDAARYLLDIGMDPAGGTSYSVVIPDIAVAQGTNDGSYIFDTLGCLLAIDIPAGAALAARAAGSAINTQDDLEVAVYAF